METITHDLIILGSGLAGLRHQKTVSVENKLPIERYWFAKQETEVREEKELYYQGAKFGTVVAVDLAARTVDVKKTKKSLGLHPAGVYLWDAPMNVSQQADALFRVGQWVAANGIETAGRFQPRRARSKRRRSAIPWCV